MGLSQYHSVKGLAVVQRDHIHSKQQNKQQELKQSQSSRMFCGNGLDAKEN